MKCDEIFAALAMLEKERGISQTFMMDKIVQALTTAYKRDHEGVENVVVDVDEAKRDLKMYVQKEVVEEVENPGTQMSLEDAKKLSAKYEVGSIVNLPVDNVEFGRIAAGNGKQVIIQGLREAESGMVYEEYNSKQHEILTGVVTRIDPRNGSVALRIGTGAEATRSCIIASQTLGVKATLSSQAAKADFVYLDPQITKSLPPYVTATTGMDAIAHACEALCCTKSNLFTEMICGKSLELSWANLLTAYKEPDNLEARANMSMAAYLGLTGESYGNCGHSMAHAIGARFHVPHGHCCAWTAPVALYFTRKECDHEIRLIARCFGMDDRPETVAADVANAMKKLVWEMNIATPAERGISREEFVSDATVEKVMLDPIWHFCATEFNEDTARQLLGEVYDQKLY